jgi:hypothetical protein
MSHNYLSASFLRVPRVKKYPANFAPDAPGSARGKKLSTLHSFGGAEKMAAHEHNPVALPEVKGAPPLYLCRQCREELFKT